MPKSTLTVIHTATCKMLLCTTSVTVYTFMKYFWEETFWRAVSCDYTCDFLLKQGNLTSLKLFCLKARGQLQFGSQLPPLVAKYCKKFNSMNILEHLIDFVAESSPLLLATRVTFQFRNRCKIKKKSCVACESKNVTQSCSCGCTLAETVHQKLRNRFFSLKMSFNCPTLQSYFGHSLYD